MKILVTGCGGMLGEAVWDEFRRYHEVFASDIDCNEEWLHYLDVRHRKEVSRFVNVVEPHVILHLAAITDLEQCELDPALAYDTNFMGTCNVVAEAKKRDVPFVYVSSAGVFDGGKIIYSETDEPNPINVYAKSKYAGELAALAYPKSAIVRAGWMMGGGPAKDKKFVNKIMKQLRGGSKEILVVGDKLGTPTYTYELAKVIRSLVESGMSGIFHGACDGGGSRVDVAREMVSLLGLMDGVTVRTVHSEHFKREYFAKRPYSEKLDSLRLGPALDWKICLKDYLERFEWGV